eukprot:5927897-Prymnesium_polylepis.1
MVISAKPTLRAGTADDHSPLCPHAACPASAACRDRCVSIGRVPCPCISGFWSRLVVHCCTVSGTEHSTQRVPNMTVGWAVASRATASLALAPGGGRRAAAAHPRIEPLVAAIIQ